MLDVENSFWQQKGKDIDHVGSFSHVSAEVGSGHSRYRDRCGRNLTPYEANFFNSSMRLDSELVAGFWGLYDVCYQDTLISHCQE